MNLNTIFADLEGKDTSLFFDKFGSIGHSEEQGSVVSLGRLFVKNLEIVSCNLKSLR